MDEWLPVSGGSPPDPESAEGAFLTEARTLLDQLRPVRANNTWAAPPSYGLTLVIPLDRSHDSSPKRPGELQTAIQLLMRDWKRGPEIVGDWQHAQYAWDYEPKQLAFRVAGHGPNSRSQALSWLRTQLERPIVRDEWVALGLIIAAAWRHSDGGPNLVGAIRGLFPVALLFRGHPTRSAPAGFFDPW
jgi:hypothetical protein